jgi:hypothetical protein
MEISTCSGAISLTKELENESAKVYQEMAQKFEKDKDLFLAFAKENGKFYSQVERAYYGVITDALEGCFAFHLNPEDYQFKKTLPKDISLSNAVAEALKMEETMLRFCQTAAEQSKHLMADVPRAFSLVAKKRNERISKLKALLDQAK